MFTILSILDNITKIVNCEKIIMLAYFRDRKIKKLIFMLALPLNDWILSNMVHFDYYHPDLLNEKDEWS